MDGSMNIVAHSCAKCRIPGDLPNETLFVYDGDNVLVGKLYRFVVVDNAGLYYAKAVASDATWLAYEAEQMQKAVPALYPAAYQHAGRLNLTSAPQADLGAAAAALEGLFAEARGWLAARLGGDIEIVG